jgi:hypothetical protein
MEQENCLNYRYLQDPYGCTHKSNIIYSKSFLVFAIHSIYVCVMMMKKLHTKNTQQHNNTRRFQRLKSLKKIKT